MRLAAVRAVSPRRASRYWRRNLDVFLATWRTTVLPPILEPILYLVAFGAGVGMLIGGIAYRGQQVSYLAFVAPGMIAVGVLFWAFFEGTYSTFVRFRYQRTLEAVMSTPLTPDEILVGEIVWAATKGLVAGFITGGVVAAIGLLSWPSSLLLPFALALGSLAFAARGGVFCGRVKSIDAINVPTFLFVMPMYLFSGTFFPLDVMPPWARAIAHLLPLTYLVSMVRALALGRPTAGLLVDAAALAATSAIFMPLAVRGMRRKIVK
jgi:lipooligosaccharide transport system permease protein